MSAAATQLVDFVHDTSAPKRPGDLVNGPWALNAELFLQVRSRYEEHRRGPKIDLTAFKKSAAFKQADPSPTFNLQGGVAVIPVVGLLVPKANLLLAQICGATSLQVLGEQVKAAAADARVKAIVLSVDSPGGSVWGAPELADVVYSQAKKKPIVAHTSGRMTGAAYWIGCAANAVAIGGPATEVGSVEVLLRRPADPETAYQSNKLFRGMYMHAVCGMPYHAQHVQAYTQHRVNYLYSVFVQAVAKARGMDVHHARTQLASGRTFTTSQAIEAGMADECMGLDALIEDLATQPSAYAKRRRVRARAQRKGVWLTRPKAQRI